MGATAHGHLLTEESCDMSEQVFFLGGNNLGGADESDRK
jgi:hypothetical protein